MRVSTHWPERRQQLVPSEDIRREFALVACQMDVCTLANMDSQNLTLQEGILGDIEFIISAMEPSELEVNQRYFFLIICAS